MFPNMLMANCMKLLEDNEGKIGLEKLLAYAYSDILQKKQVEAGMCIIKKTRPKFTHTIKLPAQHQITLK